MINDDAHEIPSNLKVQDLALRALFASTRSEFQHGIIQPVGSLPFALDPA